MFFITCFEKCEKDVVTGMPDVGDKRTVGYYEDLETCRRALHENFCDVHFCMNMLWWNALSRESIQERRKSNGFNGITKKEDSLRSQNLNAPTAAAITRWDK